MFADDIFDCSGHGGFSITNGSSQSLTTLVCNYMAAHSLGVARLQIASIIVRGIGGFPITNDSSHSFAMLARSFSQKMLESPGVIQTGNLKGNSEVFGCNNFQAVIKV